MKVLFVGNYGDGTGYGKASEALVLSLNCVVDVVPRRIQFNNRNQIHPDITLLENKSEFECEICIQHTLPIYFSYDGRFKKCIGSFDWETNSLPVAWVKSCNMMDEIWVGSLEQKNACIRSGVIRPIHVIKHACDINKYTKSYIPKHPLIKELSNNKTFYFYTIGEFIKRKNHLALLRAFHTEFQPHENVNLVIKSSREGLSPQESMDFIQKFCLEAKTGMRLYGNNIETYKKEIIITESLSEYDLMSLHKTCHCFVQPSYGEAFSLPAFDAAVLGKTPIVTACGGFLDYIRVSPTNLLKPNGYLVKYHMENVFGVADCQPDLYTGREEWCVANIEHLKYQMRAAYQNHVNSNPIIDLDLAERFSYQNVGKELLEIMKG